MKFIIKLKGVHDATGLSVYAVTKETGLAYNTVKKYALSDQVELESLSAEVMKLVDFYGLDWRDPDVIELVQEAPGDEQGQRGTPLLAV